MTEIEVFRLNSLVKNYLTDERSFLTRLNFEFSSIGKASIRPINSDDSLIAFYELISLAILSGYLSNPLEEGIRKSMMSNLDYMFIRQKNLTNNRLLRLLQKFLNSNNEIQTNQTLNIEYFEQFLLLNGELMNDLNEKSGFLWNLQFINKVEEISSLNRTINYIKSEEAYTESFFASESKFVTNLVHFLSFLEFVNEYSELLQKMDSNLQSASFHYFHRCLLPLFQYGEDLIFKYMEVIGLYSQVHHPIPVLNNPVSPSEMLDWRVRSYTEWMLSVRNFYWFIDSYRSSPLAYFLQELDEEETQLPSSEISMLKNINIFRIRKDKDTDSELDFETQNP